MLKENRDGSFDVKSATIGSRASTKELLQNIVFIFEISKKCQYLCSCEWIYGIYFVGFWALWLTVRVLQWYHFFRLDELPEFSRNVLEVMRQPLEDRIISISRAKYSTEYPASFMLVASMNPCPCGYYGHPKKKCVCNEYQRTHYMSKISGPLLDRIDLQIEVQPVDFDQMSSKAPGEPSAAIRQRVIAARMLQERRFKDEPGIHCNAQMTPSLLHKYAEPNAAGLEKLKDAMERMNMSARAYDRILKVARTIADLEGTADVLDHHIMEAIAYRNLDRPTYLGIR